MDCDLDFVYYTVMTGSEDQTRPIYMDKYLHIYILPIYLHVFFNVSAVNFMKYVLNANPRYNLHMHHLMNFDFLEYY